MAFGRLERTTAPKPMGDINMTPLIDVMLVLLVIFIITAPLMTASLKLDLPQVDSARGSEAVPKFIVIGLTADGAFYLGEQKVGEEALDAGLADAARQSTETEIQLHADRQVSYGQVAALIGRVQKAGLNRIAFVTQPQGGASAPR